MKIRAEALELAFRIVLSCPCDVSHEQELAVFAHLRGMGADEVADYAPVLDVFGAARTPFHRLADFTRWVAPAGGEPVIEREHVLRLNSSSYHWEHAASTLPSASRRVTSVSSWMLAHMLLPVRLETDGDGEPRAVYEYGGAGETSGGRILLRHVFLPPELARSARGIEVAAASPEAVAAATARSGTAGANAPIGHDDGLWSNESDGSLWAIHFAAIVGRLSIAEAHLMTLLLGANEQLVLHRAAVSGIDYRGFELQGDNREFCRRRHEPFWGGGQASFVPGRDRR